MRKVKIGIVGIGAISGIYLKNITETFTELEIVGVCDLIRERAEKAVADYNIPKLYENMHELFADPEVEIVLNLTRPYEHYDVTAAALEAGKHVYSEKPLGATLEEGRKLVALAQAKELMLGGAPDTFMGAGIQTCRKLIDDGFIGDVIGSAAFMLCHGHETWHPDPEFYYKHGGGPMMDMGPYYITALVNLMGGVSAITGVTTKAFDRRVITSKEHCGEIIDVDVPTNIMGIMEFDSGAVGTIHTSFDTYYDTQARLEIYGTKGTLIVPDPNCFGGPIKLLRPENGSFADMPLCFDYKENSRALGLADMGKALVDARDFRADYHQTLHVLEILTAFQRSSDKGGKEIIESKFTRKAPMGNFAIHGIIE